MFNFSYNNPTRIYFGKGEIAKLKQVVSRDKKVLILYGQGSVLRNGVLDEVRKALEGYNLLEFGGIEPNPEYETLMKAVCLAREHQVDFLLAVGGGSVIDGTKFIAAAFYYHDGDPWEILSRSAPFHQALPLGTVLTLPATGSEANSGSVISRRERKEKLFFVNPLVYPQFSILDPESTYSLPTHTTACGIVDAFVHVLEQYITYPSQAHLQDRMSEAILLTLKEYGPQVLEQPRDYDLRANIMWCATMALNDLIGCGVAHDWATHGIGHEITALFGLAHGESLAVIYPQLLSVMREEKRDKILQYATRVWQINNLPEDEIIDLAIEKTKMFFKSLGLKVRLRDYGLAKSDLFQVTQKIQYRLPLGERQNVGEKQIREILELSF